MSLLESALGTLSAMVLGLFGVEDAPQSVVEQPAEIVTITEPSDFSWDWLFPSQEVTVSQGDLVNFPEKACTVAYVSPNGYALTSSHCGPAGSPVQDSFGNTWGTVLEAGAYVENGPPTTWRNDWSIIQLESPAVAGDNGYSGDQLLVAEQANIGEEACLFGATTQQLVCSTISANENGHILLAEDIVQQGDSGAGIFIPGRGLIGVLLGELSWEDGGTNTVVVPLNPLVMDYLQ